MDCFRDKPFLYLSFIVINGLVVTGTESSDDPLHGDKTDPERPAKVGVGEPNIFRAAAADSENVKLPEDELQSLQVGGFGQVLIQLQDQPAQEGRVHLQGLHQFLAVQ